LLICTTTPCLLLQAEEEQQQRRQACGDGREGDDAPHRLWGREGGAHTGAVQIWDAPQGLTALVRVCVFVIVGVKSSGPVCV